MLAGKVHNTHDERREQVTLHVGVVLLDPLAHEGVKATAAHIRRIRNGAGKTTAFNMITGVYTPTSGDVIYTDAQGEEQKITGKRPSEIAKMGVARTFQNIRLFKNLSVYENVMIAKHLHLKSDFMSAALHLPWYNKEQREMAASFGDRACVGNWPASVAFRRAGSGYES